MNAEKSIVNHWLNSRGYFTINNFNPSGNRNIGILAIKFRKNHIEEVIHSEVICSITSFPNQSKNLKKIIRKFSDAKIEQGILEELEIEDEFSGYTKLLVAGNLPESAKASVRHGLNDIGIGIIEFEEILLDVMQNISTAYFKDDVLRALQLVKYVLLSDPEKLAKLLSDDGSILNANTRGQFLNSLLRNELMMKEFTKTDDSRIIDILKRTSLRKPENLAKALENDIMNKRSLNKLVAKLTKRAEVIENKENSKSLEEFF